MLAASQRDKTNFFSISTLFVHRTKNRKPCKSKTYRAILVPLRDEILNLRKDFLEIVDYLNYNPAVIKILNGF